MVGKGAPNECLHHGGALEARQKLQSINVRMISPAKSGIGMLDKRFLDDLNNKIAQLLPRAEALGEDARKALRQLLQKSFDGLNILTQEDFDASARALERAQQRIAELENKMSNLEQQLENIQIK